MPLTGDRQFLTQWTSDGSPDDPNLVSADELVAFAVPSSIASTATSTVVSQAASGGLASAPISTADSKAVSAGLVGSVADSKSLSGSINTSVSDSKAISVSKNTSIADSKATSVGTQLFIPQVGSIPGFLAVASTAVLRTANSKMADVISVYDFGARGNGSTDDTTAIQNTIDAAAAAGAAVVLLPRQTVSSVYKISAPLTITSGIGLIGEHENVSIKGYGLSASQYVVDVGSASVTTLIDVRLENLTLLSNDSVPSLLRLRNASQCLVRNVLLRDGQHGIVLTGVRTFENVFDRVIYLSGLSGDGVRFDAFTGGGPTSFFNCSLGGLQALFVKSDSTASSIVLVNTNIEGCTDTSASITLNGTVNGFGMFGCRAESNAGNQICAFYPSVGNTVYGITIHGGSYTGSAETQAFLLGGNGGTVRGFSIMGVNATGFGGYLVNLNGDGQSGIVAGNQIGTTAAAINASRPGVLCINNENNSGAVGSAWRTATTTAVLATGAGHTVDDVISALQTIGFVKQS